MKFLILGCNGMAGHTISLYLKERGHSVCGFARSKSKFIDTVIGDALNENDLRNAVINNKYDCVINCLGILNQFAEKNKTEAVYINAFVPHYLAKLTEGTQTQIIHMSTDCVFSGLRGKYKEDDVKDGTSFYDRSKALGELSDEKNLTIRSSIIGPDMNPNGIGLMNWFLQQQDCVVGYTKTIWTGQTTLQMAKTMEKAAENRVYGIYNMVPDDCISKFELLDLMNEYFFDGNIQIEPVDGRELDKSLVRTKWDFDYKIPGYDEMISEMATWMVEHKNLYPHYRLDNIS